MRSVGIKLLKISLVSTSNSPLRERLQTEIESWLSLARLLRIAANLFPMRCCLTRFGGDGFSPRCAGPS